MKLYLFFPILSVANVTHDENEFVRNYLLGKTKLPLTTPEIYSMGSQEEAAARAKNEEEKRQHQELLATVPAIDGSSTS